MRFETGSWIRGVLLVVMATGPGLLLAEEAQPAATGPRITDLYAQGDFGKKLAALVTVSVSRPAEEAPREVTVACTLMSSRTLERFTGETRVRLDSEATTAGIRIPMSTCVAWSPSVPYLYGLEVALKDASGKALDSRNLAIGFRNLRTEQGSIVLNDRAFYVRGCGSRTFEWIESLDREGALKRLRRLREYGFNAERHALYCPTDTYLDAADEVGVVQQVEIASLFVHKGALARMPDALQSSEFARVAAEWEAMIRRVRRHPSILIYGMGEDIDQVSPSLDACMDALYRQAKGLDPATLVVNRAGSEPSHDLHGPFDCIERCMGGWAHVAEYAREALFVYLRGNRRGLADRYPILANRYPEVGAFPDPSLRKRYEELPPWFEAFLQRAEKQGVTPLLDTFMRNNRRIQFTCIKELIEEARKFPDLDGYWLYRFNDGGEEVSGIVDDSYDPKPGLDAKALRAFNADVAILCSYPRPVLANDEPLKVRLTISNLSAQATKGAKVRWTLFKGKTPLKQGQSPAFELPPMSVNDAGELLLQPSFPPEPAQLRFAVTLENAGALNTANEWTFWIVPRVRFNDTTRKAFLWDPANRLQAIAKAYPFFQRDTSTSPTLAGGMDLAIADSWTPALTEYLASGGRILFINDKSWPPREELGPCGLHVTRTSSRKPVFPDFDDDLAQWLTIPSNNAALQGNCATVIAEHPALKNVPNDGYADLQFLHLIRRAKTFDLDAFPVAIPPIVRAVDNFHRLANKAYLAEARVEQGKLLLCSFNIVHDFDTAPEVPFVFDQLVQYCLGREFNPTAFLSRKDFERTLRRDETVVGPGKPSEGTR